MPQRAKLIPLLALAAVASASPALAYIGPGAGLGALAVTVAVGLGVLFLIVGLVWYPLKRMLGKSSAAKAKSTADE